VPPADADFLPRMGQRRASARSVEGACSLARVLRIDPVDGPPMTHNFRSCRRESNLSWVR
jgi:hypothetical protein